MKTIDLTWLCFPIACIIPTLLAVYFRIRSDCRFVERYRAARQRGAFNDMNAPEYKHKFRWLALAALSGLLIMMTGLLLVLLIAYSVLAIPVVPVIVIAGTGGLIGAAGGLLMQREFTRRHYNADRCSHFWQAA